MTPGAVGRSAPRRGGAVEEQLAFAIVLRERSCALQLGMAVVAVMIGAVLTVHLPNGFSIDGWLSSSR